ncbi:MAG TPA: hypothetical protein VJR05_07010 [Acidimicrobiia bacterium]|nr:hypothetical protein [Acidimicrobiia bacterium]
MPPNSKKEADLDRIYSGPLEDFVKARNDLASRLRQEGEAEEAAAVASLKKPSISAWIVNQLIRRHEVEVRRLIKAGESLEQAQRDTVTGKQRAAFDASRREEAESLRRLRTAVKQVAPSASAAVAERAVATLRAGAATEEGRQQLRAGRLTEDLEPAGFDVLAGLAPASETRPAKAPKQATKRTEQQRHRLEEARADLEAKVSEAKELERQASEAERVAKNLARAAASARQRAEQAADRVRRLQEQLDGP